MSTFLTGDDLNDAIDNIIINAKKHIIITSPFIKLDDHYKERFNLIKNNPFIYLQVLFGKNEDNFYRSIKSEDLEYFKSFPNVSIIYEPRLHAKSYVNETEGIITSMNLYDYSAENNVEYGLAFNKNKLTEKVYEDHLKHHFNLLRESAHCIFIKRPVFKKSIMGLSKNFIKSEVLLDVFNSFNPNKKSYERVVYQDIDVVDLTEKDIVPVLKSRSEKRLSNDKKTAVKKRKQIKKQEVIDKQKKMGFCIRTGEQIPFNPDQPLSMDAWKVWNRYGDADFPENYCHETGRISRGSTSMRRPILRDDR